MSNKVKNYINERKPKPLCLGYVTLSVKCNGDHCLKFSHKDLKEVMKGERHVPFVLNSLSVTELQEGLQLSFWCKSGIKAFKLPTPSETQSSKNCVEVAIFQFTTVALRCINGECAKCRIDMYYITDLSPCPDCVARLPKFKSSLKANFPNIGISEEFVISYETYRKEKKWQDKNTWRHLKKFMASDSNLPD